MKRLLPLSVALLLIVVAFPLVAADAYLVRFHATGHGDVTGNVVWSDDVLFFNRNAQAVAVTFLGVSNGSPAANAPTTLTLPPGRTVSLNAAVSDKWDPPPAAGPIWTLHLDVPTGVTVESRDEFYFLSSSALALPPQPLGKVSMPVFRSLAAAGEPQVHLGTDLSGNDSRINVGIYNAGVASAVATIEVRRTCDDVVVDSRTVSIPADTTLHVGGLQRGDGACDPFGWRRYTVVTVSQPSLSYVSNLNDGSPKQPGLGTLAPIVGLAVSQNSAY